MLKYISLDTSDRLDPTSRSTNCNLALSDIETTTNYDRIVLLGAVIPKSWYLVPSNNNTFTLNENGNLFTVTVTRGNYSLLSLATELQTALNNAGAWTYTVSAGLSTGHLTFTVSGNGGIQPILSFDELWARILGFEGSTTATFSANSLESTTVCVLQKTLTVILKSSLVADDGILGQLFSGVQDLSIISYTCPSPYLYARKLTSVSKIMNITLLDAITETELDLNGGNFQFQVGFFIDVVYPALGVIIATDQRQRWIAMLNKTLDPSE